MYSEYLEEAEEEVRRKKEEKKICEKVRKSLLSPDSFNKIGFIKTGNDWYNDFWGILNIYYDVFYLVDDDCKIIISETCVYFNCDCEEFMSPFFDNLPHPPVIGQITNKDKRMERLANYGIEVYVYLRDIFCK